MANLCLMVASQRCEAAPRNLPTDVLESLSANQRQQSSIWNSDISLAPPASLPAGRRSSDDELGENGQCALQLWGALC